MQHLHTCSAPRAGLNRDYAMLQISKVRPDFRSTFQLLSALTRLLLLRSTSNFEIIPELFPSFQRYQNCRENLTEKNHVKSLPMIVCILFALSGNHVELTRDVIYTLCARCSTNFMTLSWPSQMLLCAGQKGVSWTSRIFFHEQKFKQNFPHFGAMLKARKC